MKVSIVVARNGCFLKFDDSPCSINQLLVNGEPVKMSMKSGWYIGNYPKEISYKKHLPNINYRFELIDPINFPSLPSEMPKDEVMTDNGDGCEWRDDLKHLRGLYRMISDSQEPKTTDISFVVSSELHVDRNIGEGVFSYSTKSCAPITEKDAKIYGIDELFYPNIVHELLPCKLTSKETFEIIRKHVNDNINPLSAKVTSDYDFHFEVKKFIRLQQPETVRKELKTSNGRSYKNKKYREYTVTKREFTVFSMYYNWRGYGPDITPFSGDSAEDLKNKIDSYLVELMESINTPLVDCPHCNGMGVVVDL